jgi:serine/threonine protein kinase
MLSCNKTWLVGWREFKGCLSRTAANSAPMRRRLGARGPAARAMSRSDRGIIRVRKQVTFFREAIAPMNSNPKSPPADLIEENTVEASFALLELCLEQLAGIAPVADATQILDLIPEISLVAQRLILVELIKFDLATASESGALRSLEFYWPAVGAILPQERIPFDLVLEEVQLRKAAGDTPKWEDYRQRFPDLADTIGKWLAGGDSAFSGVTSKVPELPVGGTVDDFQIIKQLGQGAFARVYLAKQESMQRLVALKATSRGSEEPQALSQLDHANIVRVYDQREIVQPPTILLYMQYLAGGTLADCIKQVRELPASAWNGKHILDSIDQNLLSASQSVPEQSSIRARIAVMDWPEVVAWIGIQLAEGLGYANEKGVLHRDVKPANILLSAEAVPKLADFNVSCSGLSGRAGAAAYFGGSLAYMSPEQLQVADPADPLAAEHLDGRSDLYALGIVLWELWQGKRPWTLTALASNWPEAVMMQRDVRGTAFEPTRPANTPAERVLEKVLRSLLEVTPSRRPKSGKETAARLRLAFHPELAIRFEPPPNSLPGRLLRTPVLLISAIIIFAPNTAASVFNYFYNLDRMKQLDAIPEIMEDFVYLSNWVNGSVFPLGAILFFIVVSPVAKIVGRGKQGMPASDEQITRLWNIGNKATLICGILWFVSGLFFAISFSSLHAEFGISDAFHFFISLVLCGGVAWIYPYFGMTLLSLLVYYPMVIAPSMDDPKFAERCQRVRKHSRWYLLSAAAIPLTAVGALVFREDLPKTLILAGVCVTALGLLASFFAYQKLEETMRQFAKVLANDEAGSVI